MQSNPLFVALALLACLPGCSSQPDRSSVPDPVQISEYPEAPLEDRDGNLWFATAFQGLIRYDGTEFVTFTIEDGLGSNTVRDIIEDSDGVLWVATGGGLSRYSGESFTTLVQYEGVPFSFDSFGGEGNHRQLWDVMQDRSGRLWIATMDGVFSYDGRTFSPFELPVVGTAQSSEFTPKMVYCVFEDRDGVLWFGTDGAGVVSYDGTSKVVYTMQEHGLCSDRVCVIAQDKRGDLWFGTSDGGVSRYDGESFTTHLRSATFSKHFGWGRFMDMLEDSAGYMWFGACSPGGGAYRYDGETFRYFSQPEGLGDGGVPSVREDRSGNVWLGTTSGVFRFDGESFINFTKDG